MKNLFSITALAAVMLTGASASAAEFPTFELMGFPITPHQVVVLGSAHVQEQSAKPTLTFGGMPASPHQLAVLTPRSRTTETAAATQTKTGSSVRRLSKWRGVHHPAHLAQWAHALLGGTTDRSRAT